MKLQDQIIAGLKAAGYSIAQTASRKYVTMECDGNRVYVGKAGALRRGKTIALSVPVSQRYKQHVIELGQRESPT